MKKKTVAIIGGGPAAMALAAFLDAEQFDVSLYEKNKTLGRKFLVAGKGGFNLTHSEDTEQLIKRYTPDTFLESAIAAFDNQAFRDWLKSIAIPTFIGSSKRIFPEEGIKPIEVLNKILHCLEENNVQLLTGEKWIGWDENNALQFESGIIVKSDLTVFALGGGSWKVTGSDGTWLKVFKERKVKTKSFQPANCAYAINWPIQFLTKNEGQPLKNISISCDGKTQVGEAVITAFGLEGNAVYALSPQVQKQLDQKEEALIFIDLKPMLSKEEIFSRLVESNKKNISDTLRKSINLSSLQVSLLKAIVSKEQFMHTATLANYIKSLPLTITTAAPIDEAISTTGGIQLKSIKPHFELKKIKNTFCIGEMLDWNAPTGGYLLQACFSMGFYLADYLNDIDSKKK